MSERRVAELVALGIGLAVFGYLGWDGALWDARLQFLIHLAAVAAVAGLAAVAWRGGALPRTRLDIPVLALLLAFAVASLSAWNAGLSARALAGIVVTAAALPLAVLAIRHRPGWTAAAVTLPIAGLSIGAVAVLGWRRLEWFAVGAPGLPPVRLGGEGTPFGSVAVPPFVILAALPIALCIPHRGLRLGMVGLLAGVGIPLTIVSGSRSAWVAIAVAAVALVGARALRSVRRPRLPRRLTPGGVAAGIGGAALVGVAAAFVLPRLTEATSLVYRGFLWRDTLAAWSADPLFGIGPGSMPYARMAAAPPLSFPVRQPHSHNVPLGILGDAGLVGLAAAVLLAVAFLLVAGPWRQRGLAGRAASSVLLGLGAGALFEDLTFMPGFNLLVILLAAIALLGADAVAWRPVHVRPPAVALAGVGAAALVVVMLLGDAAAVAYRFGIDAAGSGRWEVALASLERSTVLDPWHPTGPKSLAVVAERAGRSGLAERAARRAVELNPGDGASWTNLALLCQSAGDTGCARRAADRAVDTASALGRELVNAALVYEWLGDEQRADRAYRFSILTNLWTTIVRPWPREIDVGDGRAPELGTEIADLNLLVGRRVLGQGVDPEAYPGIHARMLAHAMVGERDAALDLADRALREARTAATTWDLVALVRWHYGRNVDYELAVGELVRGAALGSGAARPPGLTYDIATFRRYPVDGLVAGAERLLPTSPWPWGLAPLLAPAR
ncbi:MAG TPA: O-antigen ligase family protein [Candidatus Limnocylindria bacterium]